MVNKEEMTTFSLMIEDLVWEKDISYMDAIILHCETSGFEVEVAAKLITNSLKSRIKIEAEELNFLPRSNTAKLPF
jgi:hypothetical protein